MKLGLLKNVLLIAIMGVFVVSCMKEDESVPYVPPTAAEELALLDIFLDTLTNRGMDVDTTELGVYYVVDSIGEGALPVDGDTCSVYYTGFYVNGDVFDFSGTDPFKVVLGENKVIDGWEDGLKVFNKGAKGLLVIPSTLGYGTDGVFDYYGNMMIPPNTTLVFSIEMVNIE